MTFQATVAVVMISGPSDTQEDLNHVRQAVREWNAEHSQGRGVVYITKHFETDVVPLYQPDTDGQLIINDQLTSQSDIVIALFRHRLGSKTPRSKDSGTAEEVHALAQIGKPAHVYFWNGPTPAEVTDDTYKRKELDRLHKFRESFNPNNLGLYKRFSSGSVLRDHVKRALTEDAAKLDVARPTSSGPSAVDIPELTVEISGTIWRLPNIDAVIQAAMKADLDEEQRYVDSLPNGSALRYMNLGSGSRRRPVTVKEIRAWEERAWDRKSQLDEELAAALGDPLELVIRSTGTLRDLSVEVVIPDVLGQKPMEFKFSDMWVSLRREDDTNVFTRMYHPNSGYSGLPDDYYDHELPWQQDGDDVVVDVEVEDLRKKRLPESWSDLVALMMPAEKGTHVKQVEYTWSATAANTGAHEFSGRGTIDVIDGQVAATRALKFIAQTDED